MTKRNPAKHQFFTMAALTLALLAPGVSWAHCDGLDGPVVKAARQALATGNVNLALIWIQAGDEPEIRRAFAQAVAVRGLGPEAKQLAERYFFETLVRLHRAGEGAPYTGLKPAGRDLGPAIPAADKAVEDGSAAALVQMLTEMVAHGIQERLQRTLASRKYRTEDIGEGREHVRAYVEYVHYVEGLYKAARGLGHDHTGETTGGGAHEH